MQMVSSLFAQMQPCIDIILEIERRQIQIGACMGPFLDTQWYTAFPMLKKIGEKRTLGSFIHLLVMCFIKCTKLKYKLNMFYSIYLPWRQQYAVYM